MPGLAWPLVPPARTGPLLSLLEVLRATERLAPTALAAGQTQQLATLVAHHAAHTPSFAARLRAAGLAAGSVSSLAGLRRLPPLQRREVQDLGVEFFSRGLPVGHVPPVETRTSGSTGQAVTVRRTPVTQLFWSAYALREHDWFGREDGGRLASIRPAITQYVEADSWGPPLALRGRTGRAQGIPISTDVREQARLLATFDPHTLLVYPNNLAALVAAWADGAGAPPSLRHVKTVGETVSEELRERVREATGLGIEDSYSCQEVGVLAVQCPASGLYHVMAESVILEVLDANDAPCARGEVGRVVVTDLVNFASPLIRYEVGDLAEVGEPCSCSRRLPTLRRIAGRSRNLLRRPDGSRHWPLVGYHDFHDVAAIRQFQLVQHALERFELRVVTDALLTVEQQTALAAIVVRSIGFQAEVAITQQRDYLARSAAGKFEEFVSRLEDGERAVPAPSALAASITAEPLMPTPRRPARRTLPFVSVVTPTRNRRLFIPQLLRGFRHQDYPAVRMELVVVDDGSDPVGDLLDGLPNVRYVRVEESLKIGRKRNLLTELARGDLIVHMDDDDYYPRQRVSGAVQALEGGDFEIAGTSSMLLYDVRTGQIGQSGPFGPYHATGATMACTRRYLENHRFDDAARKAEESTFTAGFTVPMVQLSARQTVLALAHAVNTVSKANLRLRRMPYSLADIVDCPESLRFYRDELPRLQAERA